jgi:hypothetical protein
MVQVFDFTGTASAEGAPSFSRFLREGWEAKLFAQRNEPHRGSSIATRPSKKARTDSLVARAPKGTPSMGSRAMFRSLNVRKHE